MVRFPGYLLCHPRTVERIVSGTLRSVLPLVRSVLGSTLRLRRSQFQDPGNLIYPRQVGERKNCFPAAVCALPVSYVRAALGGSLVPTYVVLDSTKVGEKMDGFAP